MLIALQAIFWSGISECKIRHAIGAQKHQLWAIVTGIRELDHCFLCLSHMHWDVLKEMQWSKNGFAEVAFWPFQVISVTDDLQLPYSAALQAVVATWCHCHWPEPRRTKSQNSQKRLVKSVKFLHACNPRLLRLRIACLPFFGIQNTFRRTVDGA